MAISIDDMRDWLAILREHPEWRAEVRREVLSEELLSLPDLVRQNGENIRDLREVVAQNSVDIRELKEIVAQNSADIRQLAEEIRSLNKTVAALGGRLGSVEGKLEEMAWRDNYRGRFGAMIRKSKLVAPDDLDAFEDAVDGGSVSPTEALAIRRADLLISGRRRTGDHEEVLLVVDVSVTIEDHDISRAIDRAEILRRVGYPAVPVVAGARISPILRDGATANGVQVVLHAA